MQFFWILLVGVGVLALFLMGARLAGGRRRVTTAERREAEGRHGRDLGANIHPSQTGNEVNLWPDRTGARTRRELGARHSVDVTFTGERAENHETATGPIQSDRARPAPQPGIRREVAGGTVEPRQGLPMTVAGNDGQVSPDAQGAPGQASHGAQEGADRSARADLAPEDTYGEDRPANRTVPPDQPPTQWHPLGHGVPGDHIRDGHHRSATGPERKSNATDPYAHAPVPGPNHIPPETGVDLPDEIRP